jgi:hypothetical protein
MLIFKTFAFKINTYNWIARAVLGQMSFEQKSLDLKSWLSRKTSILRRQMTISNGLFFSLQTIGKKHLRGLYERVLKLGCPQYHKVPPSTLRLPKNLTTHTSLTRLSLKSSKVLHKLQEQLT